MQIDIDFREVIGPAKTSFPRLQIKNSFPDKYVGSARILS